MISAPQRCKETVHNAGNKGLNPPGVAPSCWGVKFSSVYPHVGCRKVEIVLVGGILAVENLAEFLLLSAKGDSLGRVHIVTPTVSHLAEVRPVRP